MDAQKVNSSDHSRTSHDHSLFSADTAASTCGALIVIEGLDRAGKTTQVQLLTDALLQSGSKVKKLRFPDRSTTIGQMIDKYLKSEADIEDHVIHLLFSANRWEQAASIKQSLEEGCIVIVDRYYYSGMIYSAAKQNPLLPLDWAREPEVGLPRPDLVIFLDLEPEQAEARGGYGSEKYEKREMQQRVRSLFLSLKSANEDEANDMIVVDAGRCIEDVHVNIFGLVSARLEAVQRRASTNPLQRVRKWPSK